MFKFNSRSADSKRPFGAIASGSSIILKVQAKDGVYIHRLWVEIMKDGEQAVLYPMDFHAKFNNIAEFNTEVTLSSSGIYWYRFVADTERGLKILGKGACGDILEDSEFWYQQTVFNKDFVTPNCLKGGVIYHIFVDRFNKGIDESAVFDKKGAVLKSWNEDITIVDSDGVYRANDFFGGNLQGIIDKLDYIQALGVNIIYLSPIFEAASNHRYDTGDYMWIDRLLGNEDSFVRLINEAKKRSMIIMLDGVFNHTGADSKYFNKFGNYDNLGAYQGIKSPYHDWYHFINFPDEYGCWWGITVTPTVNKRVESYRRFIFGKGGVIEKWNNLGVGGWRLDVVDELDKDFVDALRVAIKATDNNNLVIGEVWEDASIKVAYGTMRPYLLGTQLDGVMNYPFKEAILNYLLYKNKDVFIENIMTICENYPKQALDCCMTLIGTHDTVRVLNRLSGVNTDCMDKAHRRNYRLTHTERARGIKLIKLASLIQFTLPGLPTVFYGDEVGMEGFDDPINRRPFPWDNINAELLNHYRQLADMRVKYRSIFCGDLITIHDDNLLIYERNDGKGIIRVYINMTDKDITINTHSAINAMTGERLIDRVTLFPQDYLAAKYRFNSHNMQNNISQAE